LVRKPGISPPVVFLLLRLLMRPAIKFDDDPLFNAGEVGDVWSNWDLSPKFHPLEAPPAQAAPEHFLRDRHVAAESSSLGEAGFWRAVAHGLALDRPHPTRSRATFSRAREKESRGAIPDHQLAGVNIAASPFSRLRENAALASARVG